MNDIDKRLRPIVRRLNDLGLYTSGSCQGADFKSIQKFNKYKSNGGSHHQKAYIQFFDFTEIPKELVDIIDINTKLVFTLFMEDEYDTRCEIQSVSMLLNNEFHNEVDLIVDEYEKRLKVGA